MSRPKFAGKLQLVIVDIDRDNRIARNHRSALNYIQAHSAATKNRDRLSDFELRQIVDHTECGRHRATHQGGNLRGDVVWDWCQTVLRHGGALIKRRHPPRVDRPAIPIVLRCSRLNAGSLSPVQHDVVSSANVCHTRTSLENDPSAFMTEQVRKKLIFALSAINLA